MKTLLGISSYNLKTSFKQVVLLKTSLMLVLTLYCNIRHFVDDIIIYDIKHSFLLVIFDRWKMFLIFSS
jgi:hypothetical protein